MENYVGVLKKYAVFTGRASRREYWMFTLISFVVSIIVSIFGSVLKFPALSWLYGLGVLLPSLAVTARRLHDTGRSGWWILIGLIPIVGAIILLVFMVLDSQPGDNAYDSNPKGTPPAQPAQPSQSPQP